MSRRSVSEPGRRSAGASKRRPPRGLVDTAFELGINFFDTANLYSQGRSEEVLGQALAGRPRDSYVLATKLRGTAPDGGSGLSREQVLRQIDQSLERLGAEFVDVYQCHAWDPDVPLAETLEAMTEIVEAGKVRYVGCSNFTGEQIQQAVDLAREHGYVKVVSSQPEYSLLHREPERTSFPPARRTGSRRSSTTARAGCAQRQVHARRGAGRGDTRLARAEWMEHFDATRCSSECTAASDRGWVGLYDAAALHWRGFCVSRTSQCDCRRVAVQSSWCDNAAASGRTIRRGGVAGDR